MSAAHEPVAYVPLSKSQANLGEPIWREAFAAKWRDNDVWRGFDLMPLYAAPRRVGKGANMSPEETQRLAELNETVPIRREWLRAVLRSLEGPLPSGHIGDSVFLLREMLRDIINRPAT